MEREEALCSYKIVTCVFLRKPDAERQAGIRRYKRIAVHVSDVELVCDLYDPNVCIEKKPEGWTQLHVGGTDG